MDYTLITKDVETHCAKHGGFIDSDSLDQVLLHHGAIENIPLLHDPARGFLTRQRDAARREIRRQLKGSGRTLSLISRRSKIEPARYELTDLMVAGMARFQDMPRHAALTAEATIKAVARPWINMATPIARKIGPKGAKRWEDYCIAQARVQSQNMMMALDYANNAAGIDWPEELKVRPSPLIKLKSPRKPRR